MWKLTISGISFSALFAALVVVFGFISIPLGFTQVPITLQTLAVMLAGGFLGAKYGFFSMMLIVVLTGIGFPLLQGQGGPSALFGPTGGYVWMWPISAFLIGLVTQRIKSSSPITYILTFITMFVFGSLILYLSGVPWLAHVAGLSMNKALAYGFYPFIAGDAIKAIAATLILIPVRKIFPVERLTNDN